MPKKQSTDYRLQTTVKQKIAVDSRRWTVDTKKGFTLVELMVAISILSILAVIGLTVFTGQEQQARLAKVRQDFEAVSQQIQISRQAHNTTLCNITGPLTENIGCDTNADCRTYSTFYSFDTKVKDRTTGAIGSSCLPTLQYNWAKITGNPYANQPLPIDPWGSPYTFDENEDEPAYFYPIGSAIRFLCRWDMISSAGKDGILWNGDDYYFFVPPFRCTTFEFPEDTVLSTKPPGTRMY